MNSIVERGRVSARRDALVLALIYGAVAGLWIMFSDRALALLGLPLMTERFVASVKGEVYVAVTAIALYIFVTRHLRRLYASEERYHRMFAQTTQGLLVMRVHEDAGGCDLEVEDVNPAQAARMERPAAHIIGWSTKNSDTDVRMQAYFDVVREAVLTHSPTERELQLPELGIDELVAAYPIEDDLYVLGIRDVSDLRRAQDALRQQDEWIREAYVDVLDAVTGGKLILVTEAEITEVLGERLLPEMEITSADQLSTARQAVAIAVEKRFPELGSVELLTPFGEALNNVLKHAGRGRFSAFVRQGVVQLCVTDDGPGIDFRTLPKATLVSGFSTAQTLGLGFTIMLQLCDRVLISTRPGSTTVILEISPTSAFAPLASS